jgi:hypothetical protein
MRRPGRATAVLVVGAASALAIAAAASCTTFDGLTVPAADAAAGDGAFDAPAPEAPPSEASVAQGYLPLAEAARVCSLVFQCPLLASSILTSVAVPVDTLNYSLCMHWLAGGIPSDRVGFAVQAQTFTCMAQGSTCAQAGACLSIENLGPGDPRCADAGADAAERCADDGGTVLRCADGYVLHCGASYYAPGSQCLVGADGTHWCALSTNCTVQPSCIGPLLDYCGQGNNLNESVNCAVDGYTCDVASNDDSGLPNCNTGSLMALCSTAGTSCAGTVVDVCDGYQISEFHCAALGGTCSTHSGSSLCVRSDDQCTPFDPGVNTCSGSALSLCVGGRKQQVDCASLGMTCVPGSGATSSHCG